jgi:lipopolysaccharide transport system ATP-binding protein
MSDVSSQEGRTVLFVSHNMAAIRNLCRQSILLNSGQLLLQDQTDKVIDLYLNNSSKLLQINLDERKDRTGDGSVKFTSVGLQNTDGEVVSAFYSGQDAKFVCYFENKRQEDLRNFHLALSIDSPNGERITQFSNDLTGEVFPVLPREVNCIVITVPKLPLNPGRYGFTIFSMVNNVISDWVQNAAFFDVEAGDYFGTGKLLPDTQGYFLVNHSFSFQIPTLKK